MNIREFLFAPLFLIVIYSFAYYFRNKYVDKDDPTRKYFIKGLNLKILGAFGTYLIYFFYYGDGDTIWYYRYVWEVREFIDVWPGFGMKLLFHELFPNDAVVQAQMFRIRGGDASYSLVVRIATLISFPAFRTYLGIAFFFSTIAYIGIWLLYRVFYYHFPHLYKQLAYSVLYVPSIVFWGSGLFKDTITMGCVGWAVYNVYRIFIKPKHRITNALVLALNVFIITTIKTYIIACLIPLLLVWVVMTKRGKIGSKFVRISITPLLLAGTIGGAFVITDRIASTSDRFSLDQMEKRATDMVWWHTEVAEQYGAEGGGGSHYTLGDPLDFSPLGILKKAPLAINVTYFRPYLWETRNPIVFISAIESFMLLVFFMLCMLKFRLKFFGRIFRNPFLIFTFGFSILFGIGVGITSSNFGALVRYKIPSMAFFISTMVIVYYDEKVRKRNDQKRADETAQLAIEAAN